MESIKDFYVNGLHVELFQDECVDSPDEWLNDEYAFIVTTRNRHFEVIPKGYSVDAIKGYFEDNPKAKLYNGKYRVLPLYAYVHSGVSLSLGRDRYPFNCPWDSGQIGYVLVKRGKGMYTLKQAYKQAECTVEAWNQYLSGDVYYYTITDKQGDCLESCGGLYGIEYAEQTARETAESIKCVENCQKQLNFAMPEIGTVI